MKSSFHLTIHAELGAAYVPYLRKHLRKAHTILKPALTELSVALVNDQRMSDLHERFMHLAGPTDVLTFPIDLDEQGRVMTGDVAVCVPEARRRAREQGVPVRDELLLYALHGLLHLAGFDDRTKSDFNRMHRTEDDILARLGVGIVFHRQAKPNARGDR
jgi:rRNA maturation RNase YbeY